MDRFIVKKFTKKRSFCLAIA